MIKFEDERAFPVTMDHGNGSTVTNLGMTLRDYFAAKALQGFCADPKTAGRRGWEIAEEAYQVADAMLAERAK